MKKVLLATSALFLTAGVASAEITFSGTAGAGVFKQGKTAAVAAPTTAATTAMSAYTTAVSTADLDGDGASTLSEQLLFAQSSAGQALLDAAIAEAKANQGSAAVDAAKDFTVYSGIDINVTASTTTDNGMTISASTDLGGGSLLDVADKELDAQADDLTAPEVKIAYSGVTIELQNEGVDDYYDGDLANYDIGVSGAFGGLTYGLAMDTNKNEADEVTGAVSDWSATVGYSIAGVDLSVSANDAATDLVKISASYTMGAFKATLTNDNKGAAKDINKIEVAYTAGPATITVSTADDKNHSGNTNKNGAASWDVAVKYTTGAYTINASTNESDAWEADVAYDLGGGATLNVGADSTETTFAGVSFAF